MAVRKGHEDFEKQSHKEKRGELHFEDTTSSSYSMMVYALLKAGAHLTDTSSGLNPGTAHVEPTKLQNLNKEIIRMLVASGIDVSDIEVFSSRKVFQNLARDCIRKYLKQIHPDKNLYLTVPQLGLPISLQSELLYFTLQKNDQTLKND